MRLANILLLLVTLIATGALLAALHRRRLIRRLSLFIALMLFYIARAGILIAGMRLFSLPVNLQLESALSLLDLALQLALAYWLIRRLTQSPLTGRRFTGRRLRDFAWLRFAAALVIAGSLTVLLVAMLPDYSPVPLDRGIAFSGLVFLFLLVFPKRRENIVEGRLLLGFCIVSVANILSQCGRTLAAAEHDPRLFLIWAYANTAVWIGVLVFWIVRLQVSSSSGLPVADRTTAMAS